MPASLSYPGVYIEELPSSVHTITGVATSITAFVGWAPQGPVDEAVLVESWQEFVTQFGGFDANSYLGYAVNQFFNNGGAQAYIVRLVWDGTLPASPGTAPVPCATARGTGIGVASTTITATSGNISGSTALSISGPVLQSIALTPAPLPILQAGQTLQLTATGNFSDGSSSAPAGLVWASSAPAVLTVSATGLVTAGAPGTGIVSATLGAVSANTPITVSTATLASIALSPNAAFSLAAGQTRQFSATGTYSDASTQDMSALVTWSSSNTANITISAGLASVKAAGTSDITASIGTVVSPKVTVTGTAALLTGLTLTPATAPLLAVDATQQFAAAGTFSDGKPGALPAPAWTSSNPAVATVDNTGKVTGVALGTVTIMVTAGGISASAPLTVSAAKLTTITINPAAATLAAGFSQQFAAQGTYDDQTTLDLSSSVTWASATVAAATVSATGLAKAVAVGSSVVSATLDAISGNMTMTITAPVLQSIAVTPANPSLNAGGTVQFKATGTYSDASTQDLTASTSWASSNPAAASVAAGLATAVASGGTLTLFAANPGAWANSLQVTIATSPSNPGKFSLTVQLAGKTVENFVNLSTTPSDPNYVVTVIDSDSQYVTFENPANGSPVPPTTTPIAGSTVLSGGADGTPLVPASDMNFELALYSKPNAGVYLLSQVDIFNLLCVPGETDGPAIQALQSYCASERAFYIVDAPPLATISGLTGTGPVGSTAGAITSAPNAGYSAYYFPWISAPDPLFGNRAKLCPPCGFVAGIYAATDAARGVWKAPAGIDAGLSGVIGLQYTLTDLQNGDLNHQGIDCLRQFRVYGNVVWGARTLLGNDQAGSEWKYVPIRRLALYIESSLLEGTQWAVFEPNDEPLWSQLRMNIGAFMQGLFAQGAFQGSSPQQAYFVKCDAENNPQASIDLGVVNVLVGFAPLYPAEFVVIQIQQMAGQV